ncbi:hypothetical protein ACROYT_G020007 [Oculina patagonica]
MAATVIAVLVVALLVAVILAKAVKVVISSSWYKKSFAQLQSDWANLTRGVFDPLKRKLFDDLEKHLKTVNGDVLEIGIGSGANFDYYPHGTSLIAVDPNPHVEELIKANLEKVGDRIHLKKFVIASCEDMSCAGKVGVEDNSVAAVVCTKLLCSLTEDQVTKTIQEVKRVLMPGGRFYFLEHVTGNPWTIKYFLQHLLSKSLLWPSLYNGCRCDRKTLPQIEKGGFKLVQSEKIWLNWTLEMIPGCTNQFILYLVDLLLVGFAEKEKLKKKLL